MPYGDVRRIWARAHHPKWYKVVGDEYSEGRGFGGGMRRTADKIAHLRKTAFGHPEYIDVFLPFEAIFAYVDGKEGFERGK